MSVITLDQAKLYLRIDDALDPAQEAELQSMIDAAETFISRKTGYWMNPTTRVYRAEADGCIRVYDVPIIDSLAPYDNVVKNGYVLIKGEDSVALDVGYSDPADVPQDLINAALQMLKVYYYEGEKQQNTTLMPQNVANVIWNRKRFIV